MLTPIEDEFGQRWLVGKDDPVHADVQKLHSRCYTWIVLPRAQIQGRPVNTFWEEEFDWKEALREARRIGYTSEGGKRHLRLAECLKALEDK
jgi:hypothetical protein